MISLPYYIRYGEDEYRVGEVLMQLGDSILSTGNYEEAERQYQLALDIYENAFGQKHISVAR